MSLYNKFLSCTLLLFYTCVISTGIYIMKFMCNKLFDDVVTSIYRSSTVLLYKNFITIIKLLYVNI